MYIRLYRAADVVVGAQLKLDANDGIKSMKEFKQQIRDAQGDLITMSEKFGATSKEAQAAAKRVAELKDTLGDASKVADAFNPDQKFRALSQSLSGVLGGFTALTGAMGLLGVESKGVQEQLLKVQSALALSQGVNQIGEAIDSFKTLGKQLLNTFGKSGLIGGAVVAGIGAILIAIKNTKTEAEELEETTKKQYDASLLAIKGFDLEERKLRALGVAEDEIIEKKKERTKQAIRSAQAELKALDAVLEAAIRSVAKTSGLRATAAGSFIADLFFKDTEDLGAIQDKSKAVKDQIEELNVTILELDKTQKEIVKKRRDQAAIDAEKAAERKDVNRVLGIKEKKDLTQDPAVLEEQERNKLLLNERAILTQKTIDFSDLAAKVQQGNAKQTAETERIMAEARAQAANDVGSALGALSDLVGKQTAAGKVLAIAQATINTWVGVSEVLRAKSVIPEPFGTISKIANVAVIIASGLKAVKEIVKTPVPGASGGAGGGVGATAAPIQPQLGFTNTRLDANQLNQIGNATVRAFVVESDVSGSQERIRRLNRAARI